MWIERLRPQPIVIRAIWPVLAVAVVTAIVEARWSLASVAVATFALSLVPVLVQRRHGIRLPVRFLGWIVVFVLATILLGEAFDF